MRATWRKFATLISVYYAYMVEYRVEILLWSLSGALPLILMGVWMQAATSGRFAAGPVDFARYFLCVFLVRQVTVVWVVYEFEQELVQGLLSPRLLQPLDPVWRHATSHVSERLARLPFLALLVVLFFVLYPKALWVPRAGQLALALVAIAGAFALRFLMQYSSAMLAFWTERATALEHVVFLFQLFLSGTIAPLEVYPPVVRQVALATPFPYMVYFPARLLAGDGAAGLPGGSAWRGLAIMAGWTAVFFVLSRWLWRRGLRRYSAMGA